MFVPQWPRACHGGSKFKNLTLVHLGSTGSNRDLMGFGKGSVTPEYSRIETRLILDRKRFQVCHSATCVAPKATFCLKLAFLVAERNFKTFCSVQKKKQEVTRRRTPTQEACLLLCRSYRIHSATVFANGDDTIAIVLRCDRGQPSFFSFLSMGHTLPGGVCSWTRTDPFTCD